MRNRACLLLTVALLLPACTLIKKDVGHSFDLPLQTIQSQQGPVSVDTVLSTLGPPQSVAAVGKGYAFLYQYTRIEEQQLGFSSTKTPLSWLKLALADADSASKVLVVQFDSTGTVSALGRATLDSDLGDSGSVTLAVNFLSMVDSAQLEDDLWGPANWGYSLLQPLEIMLNRQNSPDTGHATLEQRGTSTAAGQRTLEYRN